MQLLASPPTQSLAADSALKHRATRGGRRPRLYREQLGHVNKKLGRQACSAAIIAHVIGLKLALQSEADFRWQLSVVPASLIYPQSEPLESEIVKFTSKVLL